jgi:hypothetical protein
MNAYEADAHYLAHVDQPYGKAFAATVGRFQEGFLRDKTPDIDEAFALAVEATMRLLPVIKLKYDMARA